MADINKKDRDGQTALFYATWKKHNNVAKALLDNGADAVHIYRNFTPHVIEADGCGAGGLEEGGQVFNLDKAFLLIGTVTNNLCLFQPAKL